MTIDRDHLERVYSRYAGFYDRIFRRVSSAPRMAIFRTLAIQPGERVLEVGVGTGLCLPWYPSHCDVVGIDLSAAMLQKAAQRVEAERLTHVSLHRMDAGEMAFAENSFDYVIAAYVVTAVPDYRRLMSEMIRVCRPGGRIILLNHFTQDSPILAAVEKFFSPLFVKVGFRSDLSVGQVIDGWPLIQERHEKVAPLGFWRVVACINNKAAGVPHPGASGASHATHQNSGAASGGSGNSAGFP